MRGILRKASRFLAKYPIVRGMMSYALIWPTSSIIEECLANGVHIKDANFSRAARYGIFGTFFMAPVFYGWMKYTGRFFKGKDLKTALLRAAVEQVTYSPLAVAYFLFGMSLLELKSLEECTNEVREKFWPTYKAWALFWPAVQTLNFYYVPEKNRVVFVSIAGLIWIVFMAHVKAKH